MKTVMRYCIRCNIKIPEKEFKKIPIPDIDGIPEFFISKIIMECPNEHPNECEVNGL